MPHTTRPPAPNPLRDEDIEGGKTSLDHKAILVCAQHGPYDAAYGSCPFCGTRIPMPPTPIFDDDEIPTDLGDRNQKPLEQFNDRIRVTNRDHTCVFKYRVKPGFQFVHEPLTLSTLRNNPIPFAGRDILISEFVSRLERTQGGAFLVTGFRGVGKTTFVQMLLALFRDRLVATKADGENTLLVDICLNITYLYQPMELMHLLVRKLYQKLCDMNLINNLDRHLRDDIQLAFRRTSLSITRKQSSTSSVGIAAGKDLVLAPEINASRQTSLDITYLNYDRIAAESDLIEIGQRLSQHELKTRNLSPTTWKNAKKTRLKIVFVFDELDKLESPENQPNQIDELLNNLKNLFTCSGITFIFVAGYHMHQRWVQQVDQGNSVLESVFANEIYLPLLWDAPENISSGILQPTQEMGHLPHFLDYLKYKGRGVPRQIIRHMNDYIHIEEECPYLQCTQKEWAILRFYSYINSLLDESFTTLSSAESYLVAEQDQIRLAEYYLTDWIMQQGYTPFSLQCTQNAIANLNTDIVPPPQVLSKIASTLLRTYRSRKIIKERVHDPDLTLYSCLDDDVSKKFQLAPEVIFRARGAFPQSNNSVNFDFPDHMFVKQEIKTQGITGVFRVSDLWHQDDLVLKILHPEYAQNEIARGYLANEINILRHLASDSDDHIVKLIDGNTSIDTLYMLLEYIDGPSLDMILKRIGVLSIENAIAFISELAQGVKHIHSKGIVRIDIKPSNIILRKDGKPVIIDFGTAVLHKDDPFAKSQRGRVIGTPYYMSPEQARGEEPDKRSDIYSLGATIFKMVTGRVPYIGHSTSDLIFAHNHLELPRLNSIREGVPVDLDRIVAKCMEKDPEARYQTVDSFLGDISCLESYCASSSLYTLSRSFGNTSLPSDNDDQTVIEIDSGSTPLSNTRVKEQTDSQNAGIEQIELSLIQNSPELAPMVPRLIILTGTNAGSVFPLTQETIIGRHEKADIVLDNPLLSRYHARVSFDNDSGQYVLADLHTVNGTYLNDTRIENPVLIQNDDIISVGDVLLRFYSGSEAIDRRLSF